MSILCLIATVWGPAQTNTQIELKNNWYYLNGQRFFIKAIGYEIGARPGQHPYQGVRADDLDLLAFDLKVIKEGGYNAIRTWSQFSEPQLKLVQDSGLKLIMGIEINPDQDYGSPEFIQKCEDSLKQVLTYARNYDCIITYLILNEPQTDHMHTVTGKGFLALMRRLMDLTRRAWDRHRGLLRHGLRLSPPLPGVRPRGDALRAEPHRPRSLLRRPLHGLSLAPHRSARVSFGASRFD